MAEMSRLRDALRNRRRPLVNEPLTADDWAAVWIAYQGFLAQIHLIVERAQERNAEAKDAVS
jgi:hypothetical protein